MINGFLLINKDPGITSSRVVQILKKKFDLKKVGHLGTLDPMATGLLIIAINRATKFASLLLQSEKSYRAEITLGIQTDTDDAEGETVSFFGDIPSSCSTKIEQPNPSADAVALSQSTTLDNNADDTVGRLFAETVHVSC